MKEPSEEHNRRWNKKNRPVVPVVIDPMVARKLRPHQIEGTISLLAHIQLLIFCVQV